MDRIQVEKALDKVNKCSTVGHFCMSALHSLRGHSHSPLSMSDCFGFFFASGYSMMISCSFVCLKYCLLGCSFVRCSVAYCSIGFSE